MTIEGLAFRDRRTLAHLNEKDLLDIIEFLQNDRKQWVNQFTQTHNESIEIQEENQDLKSQLKGTTHCYDEEEHKRLSEQLELLISKLDEYDLIVDERNQLKKQLENSIKVNMADHKYASECEDKVVTLEAHQKEFINYLEDEKISPVKCVLNSIGDKNQDYNMFKNKLDNYEEILQKYKSIIGDDK